MLCAHDTPRDDRTPARWLLLTAMLASIVLIYTARYQIYDTNFYVLWEATALVAGDHPYRDFFEWGVPLQAVLSAAAQWLSGYRLIGEFALHWMAIVAGAVMAFDIGYRLSRSLAASLGCLALALALLAVTPTFHYPKLLLYPLAIRATWWYMARPGVRRSVALGVLVAGAFLMRHDHGLYIGALAALTIVATRLLMHGHRSATGLVRDAGAGLAATLALLGPWAAIVHANEGLPAYVRYRHELFTEFSAGDRSPFWALREIDPVRTFAPAVIPPEAGTISLEWTVIDGETAADVERRRVDLERRLGLAPSAPPQGLRWTYHTDNLYDPALLDLRPYVREMDGTEWNELTAIRWGMPPIDHALQWLLQVSLLIPLLTLGAAGFSAAGYWRRGEPVEETAYRLALTSTFLVLVVSNLFREPSYVVIVAPLNAALATLFFRVRPRDASVSISAARRRWLVVRTAAATVVLAATAYAAYAYSRGAAIYTPFDIDNHFDGLAEQMLASPAIDGYVPRPDALASQAQPVEGGRVIRYLYDCTQPGDRLLVTGSTPYQVGYYAERSLAGGHLFWHHGWRSDTAGQRQQLALLERQSVPFAVSTTDPVFTDLASYPLVLAHMKRHYEEVPGTDGLLLIDRRRVPTRAWGALQLPCFR